MLVTGREKLDCTFKLKVAQDNDMENVKINNLKNELIVEGEM